MVIKCNSQTIIEALGTKQYQQRQCKCKSKREQIISEIFVQKIERNCLTMKRAPQRYLVKHE